jgi:cellobiose phosphorylase
MDLNTGSAGWMRIGVEALLGISLRRGALHRPVHPQDWPRYDVTFKPSRTPITSSSRIQTVSVE